MFRISFRIFEISSEHLRLILFLILIANVFSYININITAYESAEKFSFVSSEIHNSDEIKKESVQYIEKNKLYTDFLLPNGSKLYVTEVSENHILILFFKIDTENSELKIAVEGPINRTRLNIERASEPFIYYVKNDGEVQIIIVNTQTNTVYYKFFVDISEPLGESNSKILPLRGGQVAFHIDLKRDDTVLLKLNYSNHLNLRIWVFTLCYEIVLGKGSYMLYSYKESLDRDVFFTADLGGRYYIILESINGEGTFSLTSMITSPPWNQEWFWLLSDIVLVTAISMFLLTKIKKIRNLKKVELFAIIGYYFSLITVILSVSVIGAFNYGTWIYTLLFYFLIFSSGLSLGVQVYAAYLDREKRVMGCPYCGRKVDIKKDNYCCGHVVKKISVAWFLMPLFTSFLLFIIGHLISKWILPQFLNESLLIGSFGSIFGGIISWYINKDISRTKPWRFLVSGIIFSFLSPLLIGLLIDVSFQPHIELEWLGKLVRIRIAPLTLPPGITLTFTALAVGLGILIANQIRKIVFNRKPVPKN